MNFNFRNKCHQQQEQEQTKEQQDNYEFDGIIYDFTWNPPRQLKTKIQALYSNNDLRQQSYFQNVKVFICQNRNQIQESSEKPDFLTNLEQINHLNWIGKYGQNNLKIGKWKL
ncbi:unnamed protein product [Paramecium sonneborni]|uniref:Uncharacterized protein n=1 Tax=Paramecium sonneborni TaxID=65129 RepID=A0A8S1R1X0_9CILI|nr:unnamed protein product [Paramecium sonneborni]